MRIRTEIKPPLMQVALAIAKDVVANNRPAEAIDIQINLIAGILRQQVTTFHRRLTSGEGDTVH